MIVQYIHALKLVRRYAMKLLISYKKLLFNGPTTLHIILIRSFFKSHTLFCSCYDCSVTMLGLTLEIYKVCYIRIIRNLICYAEVLILSLINYILGYTINHLKHNDNNISNANQEIYRIISTQNLATLNWMHVHMHITKSCSFLYVTRFLICMHPNVKCMLFSG